ncbi:MAG: MlaD family protein [Nitrospiraceae bacterium]|nr:MlaD family protein [Nitrospiraceae bacterium]
MKVSTELKVGAFSLMILAIMTYMTFKVGGFDWAKKKGYALHAEFKNIGGLDEKTRIKVAGVDSGIIEKIQLKDGKAWLTIRVDKDTPVYTDASVGVKSTGMLGDKYIELKTGSQKPELKDGDTIKNVIEFVDIDELVKNFSKLASNLDESFGSPESKGALKESIQNLKHITASLKDAISVNDKKLRIVLDNIENFTAALKKDGPELVADLSKATKELKGMIEENRGHVKSAAENIDVITQKIAKGEGTIGKLVKDDRLYESFNKAAEGVNKTLSAVERFRTFITFQGDYLTKAKDSKGAFTLTLQPKPDKYYIFGIVSDPVGKITTTETNSTVGGVTTYTKTEEIKKRMEFTAQFAKKFENLALRIGLFESTFGVGADYFFLKDKAKMSVDIWDFSKDEEDAKNPHVKVGIDYFLFKNIFVSAGGDNLLNAKRRGAYIGTGVRFEDEDIKYLFGTLPRIK